LNPFLVFDQKFNKSQYSIKESIVHLNKSIHHHVGGFVFYAIPFC
jgi:hypothetical protein